MNTQEMENCIDSLEKIILDNTDAIELDKPQRMVISHSMFLLKSFFESLYIIAGSLEKLADRHEPDGP